MADFVIKPGRVKERKGSKSSWSQWPKDPEERRRDLPGKGLREPGNGRETAIREESKTSGNGLKLGGRPQAKPREGKGRRRKEVLLQRRPHKSRPLGRKNYEYGPREVGRVENFLGRVPGERARDSRPGQ